MIEASRRRSWFRYSVRTLFVLVTAVAIIAGWVRGQVQWIRDRHEAIEWAQSQRHWNLANTPDKSGLPWSVRLLGENRAMAVFHIRQKDLREQDLDRVAELKRLFPEATIEVTPNGQTWQPNARTATFALPAR